MNLDALIDTLPSYARDLKLNYSTLVRNNSELTEQQLWGTVVASAIATRSAALTAAVLEAAAGRLSAQALEAAQSAAAVMSMNNVFYRFHHLSENEKYATMPARLRMNALRGHGVHDIDFELWSLAVSAVNGCGRCIEAHEDVLLKAGMSKEAIQDAIRIAAIVFSVSVTLEDPAIADEALKAAA